MHWEEEKREDSVPIPEAVVDLAFSIECRVLPVDHAWALYEAVARLLPWLQADPSAGIHPLHVAESAHGWVRPGAPDALLYPSRRTKLVMRIRRDSVDEARLLTGEKLLLDGYEMLVGEAKVLPLSRSTSLFARRVVVDEGEGEEAFVRRSIDTMLEMGVEPKKVLPGLAHTVNTPDGEICGRLLSVEGLQLEAAFRLQMSGLGPNRLLGFGIFIPHKPLVNVRV